jgi:hypothetical protein
MKDNFDLKKFLKESKAIENLNPSLKSINDKKSKSLKENSLKSKIREMIINELSPSLDEAAAEDLELKSFSKQLYNYAKKNGAQAFIVDRSEMENPKTLGKHVNDNKTPSAFISIKKNKDGETFLLVNIIGQGVKKLYNDMVRDFPQFKFFNSLYSDTTLFPPYAPKTPLYAFNVISKKTGRKGGVMATEENVSVGGDVEGTINPVAPIDKASNDDYDFLSESDDIHEEDKDKRDMEGLVKAMMANRKAIRKREEEEDAKRQADYERHKKSMGLEEAEKDEDGEEMEDESREERADVDKFEFEKGKEAGEEEGEGGIEAIAADLDGTESDLMGNLMNALKIAKGMDNEKLEVQIGNTLKFFVSTYIDKEENER